MQRSFRGNYFSQELIPPTNSLLSTAEVFETQEDNSSPSSSPKEQAVRDRLHRQQGKANRIKEGERSEQRRGQRQKSGKGRGEERETKNEGGRATEKGRGRDRLKRGEERASNFSNGPVLTYG